MCLERVRSIPHFGGALWVAQLQIPPKVSAIFNSWALNELKNWIFWFWCLGFGGLRVYGFGVEGLLSFVQFWAVCEATVSLAGVMEA